MSLVELNRQVLVSHDEVTVIGAAEIERVKAMAAASPNGRARICAHPSDTDSLHEMVLVLHPGHYIRPHAHHGKSESFHMIEGALSVVLFDDTGAVERVVDLAADGAVFYRLTTPRFHTVLVDERRPAVFHETTNGPFERDKTVYPEWAPEESNAAAGAAYFAGLLKRLGRTP